MSQPGEKERGEAEGLAQQPGESQTAETTRTAHGLPPGAEATAEQRLQAELEEAQRERSQFKATLQRVQADFANYQKRMTDERLESQKNAGAQLLSKLFPLIDDFERALAQAPKDIESPWLDGTRLIATKFQAFLREAGVQIVDPVGQAFDPWEHEVIAYLEGKDQPDGRVVNVASKGYKLNGRVLRPAQVVVGKRTG
ncbi:MAG: nucleotide exchange factor GrpE [Dehalococcoidia bacterium]|nr:nucleotide exchange factor GrpE [Dehalococcoidia bacterium]